MTRGIQITNDKNIDDANDADFVLNTKLPGSMKYHDIFTFRNGGERTFISGIAGLFCFIQRQKHGLDYVPAYMAFKGFGSVASPDYVTLPFNNFIGVGGQSDFVNVTKDEIIVGFDENNGADFIRVVIFAEKLASE